MAKDSKSKEKDSSFMDEVKKSVLTAKKDWHIVQNDIDLIIKVGDDVSGLAEGFLQALRTEGVI